MAFCWIEFTQTMVQLVLLSKLFETGFPPRKMLSGKLKNLVLVPQFINFNLLKTRSDS